MGWIWQGMFMYVFAKLSLTLLCICMSVTVSFNDIVRVCSRLKILVHGLILLHVAESKTDPSLSVSIWLFFKFNILSLDFQFAFFSADIRFFNLPSSPYLFAKTNNHVTYFII